MPVNPDPCQEAIRLREIRTAIATGEQLAKTRFETDEVAFFKADTELLDRLIAEADAACDIQEGRTNSRRRYAIRGRARPY